MFVYYFQYKMKNIIWYKTFLVHIPFYFILEEKIDLYIRNTLK